jgi:hypothetical protein
VGADTEGEIKELYEHIEVGIKARKEFNLPSCDPVDCHTLATAAFSNHFTSRGLMTQAVQCDLINHFSQSFSRFQKISRPFSPDNIVYCKSNYLYLPIGVNEDLIREATRKFEASFGYYPKVIVEEQGGLIVIEEDEKSLQTVMKVYLDLMKISFLSEQFGGPHFMTPEQIQFIDNWEVENYRRKVAKDSKL